MGLTVWKTPGHCPPANAFCERPIATMRREYLDWLIPECGAGAVQVPPRDQDSVTRGSTRSWRSGWDGEPKEWRPTGGAFLIPTGTSSPSLGMVSAIGCARGASGTGLRGLAYTGCFPCSLYHSATVAVRCICSTM